MANKEMEIIQNAYDITNKLVESMNTPFGVLFADNLDSLINSQQFKQVDDLIKILEKNKESIYQRRDNNYNSCKNFFQEIPRIIKEKDKFIKIE